ncbi:hypothetical protein C9374_001833 [Naegleria lovaniensis]|uniref:Uncharacterized protein n=1 Tax=Naegleria lovaniensis TaxID=51637 RepID=A0AA88KLM2_NAELO|nr:uncharacterized protein C9374_001833 [Naegleria lovaniensis]KAG2386798.1 hypothetical protein C9374_001833 [Naegleria lovaniensis]
MQSERCSGSERLYISLEDVSFEEASKTDISFSMEDELRLSPIPHAEKDITFQIDPKVGHDEDMDQDERSFQSDEFESDCSFHSTSETSRSEEEEKNPCQCFEVASNTYFPILSNYIGSFGNLMSWGERSACKPHNQASQFERMFSGEEIKENLMQILTGFITNEPFCVDGYTDEERKLYGGQMLGYTQRVLDSFGYNLVRELASYIQIPMKMNLQTSVESIASVSSVKSDESDVYTFLDECFLSRFKKFSHDKFVFDKAEDLKPFYAKISESLKDKEKIPFRITNYLREYIHNNATILVSYLKHCVENRVNIDTNLRCINDFRSSWERRNTWISSENHLEVIHLQWITGMLVDFGLNVKKNCKVTPSAGISRMDSQYCQPDVCVEEKAICMEYKLENVIEFLPDIRKVCILPIVLMKEHNLKTGMGLLADRKHAYVFFIQKNKKFNKVLEWEYCQCFDLEDLGERCLLFVVLITWLVNECDDNEFILKECDDLNELAETWNEGKTSHNENASNRETNQSSQESSNRFIPNAPSSKNQSSNMNSHNNSQQRKLIMLQRKTKERSKIILNDVSHFARMKEHSYH